MRIDNGPGFNRVLVLQRSQPLGTGLAAALRGLDVSVQVLTKGPCDSSFRPDAHPLTERFEVRSGPWTRASLESLAARQGTVVVTNDESCLSLCAHLATVTRRKPSMPPDQLPAYTSKIILKRKLADAGLLFPRYVALEPVVPGAFAAQSLAQQLGLPAVAKPCRGAYNSGVTIHQTVDELADWLRRHAGEPGWQVEAFVRGHLFHANAVVADGVITPVLVGAYSGPPLGLEHGLPLGSIVLPDDHGAHIIGERLLSELIPALGCDGRFVVHVEFFIDGNNATVVDVAARAPGGLISDAGKLVTRLALEEVAFRLQLGLPFQSPVATNLSAGWAWAPEVAGDYTSLLAWSTEITRLVSDLDHMMCAWHSSHASGQSWWFNLTD